MLKTCGELSLKDVDHEVQASLAKNDLGSALDAIRSAVDTVLNNRRAIARVYASRDLDKLCEQVAAQVPKHADGKQPKGTLIIATELAAAGGHVEVIKDLVRLGNSPQPVDLLLTDAFERVDAAAQQGYAASMGVPMRLASGQDSSERLRSVMSALKETRPHTVVLLVHNQDALGVVAGLACGAQKVIFVHHGDHHLSLGVTCPLFAHVDLSNSAFHNCRHTIGVRQNSYWPLTLSIQKEHRHNGRFMDSGHLVTSCVGRPEKFDDPSYRYQYLDLVGLILRSTGGHHLHVGQLRDDQILRIKAGLDEHGVDHARFEHIPWVPSVSEALAARGVDLYLTSFPYGGGKSQVEVMASAIPTLIHANYRSNVLCGIDLGYPGVLTWHNEGDLQNVLRSLTPELLREHSALARSHFERHHSEDALRRAMGAPSTSEDDVPPLADVHHDGLQAFLDEERALFGEDARKEVNQLQHLLAQQTGEIHVLRKKARFLGSARYEVMMLWKRLVNSM